MIIEGTNYVEPNNTTSLSIVGSILGPLYNQPIRILQYKNYQIFDYFLSTLTNQRPPNFGAIIPPTHDNSKIKKFPNIWSFFSHSNKPTPSKFLVHYTTNPWEF